MNKNLHIVFKYLFSFLIVSASGIALGNAKNTDGLDVAGIFVRNENPWVPVKLVECYPNPATSYINFKFDNSVQRNYKLYIFSFTGRQMTVANVTGETVKISLENYFRGLYIYQLRDANGSILESGRFQVRN